MHITDNQIFNYDPPPYSIEGLDDGKRLFISLSDLIKSKDNKFFSFKKDNENENTDDLILDIYREGTEYKGRSGNFVGIFNYGSNTINITSRFSNEFLLRMLNFANDIYLNDISISGDFKKKDD